MQLNIENGLYFINMILHIYYNTCWKQATLEVCFRSQPLYLN